MIIPRAIVSKMFLVRHAMSAASRPAIKRGFVHVSASCPRCITSSGIMIAESTAGGTKRNAWSSVFGITIRPNNNMNETRNNNVIMPIIKKIINKFILILFLTQPLALHEVLSYSFARALRQRQSQAALRSPAQAYMEH